MPQYILLTSEFNTERGGYEAIVMVKEGPSKRRYDCFWESAEAVSDHKMIKGLLTDAKRQYAEVDASGVFGFPLSPNQVRFMRTA